MILGDGDNEGEQNMGVCLSRRCDLTLLVVLVTRLRNPRGVANLQPNLPAMPNFFNLIGFIKLGSSTYQRFSYNNIIVLRINLKPLLFYLSFRCMFIFIFNDIIIFKESKRN